MTFADILAGIFQGFDVTATVTFYGMLYAIPFAFIGGTLQYVLRGPGYAIVTAIIEFWRSSPVLILLFLLYYTLPSFGITLSGITVGALALGLNIGGYGSQAVRAALQSLDRGQVEAGLALGLRRWEVLGLIEMPQGFVSMLPSFINQFIQLVKGTALVSLITLTDMTFRAKELSQLSYDPVGTYTGLLVAYFIVCYPATILGRLIERRVAAPGRISHEL